MASLRTGASFMRAAVAAVGKRCRHCGLPSSVFGQVFRFGRKGGAAIGVSGGVERRTPTLSIVLANPTQHARSAGSSKSVSSAIPTTGRQAAGPSVMPSGSESVTVMNGLRHWQNTGNGEALLVHDAAS